MADAHSSTGASSPQHIRVKTRKNGQFLAAGAGTGNFWGCCRRTSDAWQRWSGPAEACKDKAEPAARAGWSPGRHKESFVRAGCSRDGAELIPGDTESPETKRGEAQKGPFFLFCPGDGREPHMGIKKRQVIKPPGTKRGREGEGMAERTLHRDLMGKKGAGRLRSHGTSWICQV